MSKREDIIAAANEATNPWYHAWARQRDYLTPEDVTAAIEAQASVLDVTQAVLQAVELKCAEDASLCAFLALEMFKGRT